MRINRSTFIRLMMIFSCSILLSACSVYHQWNTGHTFKQNILKNPELSSALCGITLYDLDQNKEVYSHQGNKYFNPASTQKTITCYAGLKYLGDRIPGFQYWLQDGFTLCIQPLADPTFLNEKFPTQNVLSFLKGFKRIRLYCPDNSVQRIGSGWAWDDYMYDFSAQQSLMPIYGNLATITATTNGVNIQPNTFQKNLAIQDPRAYKFQVWKTWDSNSFSILPGSSTTQKIPFTPDANTIVKLLADTLHIPVDLMNNIPTNKAPTTIYYTQATDEMLHTMMFDSDNFIAEQTMLMVGLKQWNLSQVSQIVDTLLKTDFLTLPQRPKMVDGSGLSRYNLCSPNSMVQVLNQMHHEFGWNRISKIFQMGNQGTLTGYYGGEYADRIYAKTGTLSNNSALCGYLLTKKGRKLSFAIFLNHYPGKATDARKQIEQFLKKVIDTQ